MISPTPQVHYKPMNTEYATISNVWILNDPLPLFIEALPQNVAMIMPRVFGK